MSNRKYKVLIHGAGWVSTQHIAAFENNPRSQVVAVSSRSLASAKRRAEAEHLEGVSRYDDLGTALADEDVDIVCVCTPQHVHCDNVLVAAEAGKHIVIEKPAAISLAELRSMRDAVRRAGVKTVVSFVLRWNPLFRELKRLIAADSLGQVYSVETAYQSYMGDWWSGWEDGRRADAGVSAMTVAGCHAVDALRWFAAQGEFEAADPVEVFAYSGGRRVGSSSQYSPTTDDWHEGSPLEYPGLEIALVRFANGVLGKVSTNLECIQPYAFPLEIHGDRGTVKDNRLWSHRHPGQKDWVAIPGIRPDSSAVSHHPFQGQMDHFIDCLDRNVESHTNLEDAVKTHELVFAAQQCYQTGAPVSLPLLS